MLDIRDFGQVDLTGNRSSAVALQNAIDAAVNLNHTTLLPIVSGLNQGVDTTVYIPPGTILIDQAIVIPSTPTTQRSLRIVGSGMGTPPDPKFGTGISGGGSILMMTYPGPTRAFTGAQIQAAYPLPTVGLVTTVGSYVPPGYYVFEITYYNSTTKAETSASATAARPVQGLCAPATTSSATSGGSVGPGTYYCVVTYVNGNGESTPSSATPVTVTATSGNYTISVTAPPAAGSGVITATGWKCYVGSSPAGPFYLQGGTQTSFTGSLPLTSITLSGTQPPGTNFTALASTAISLTAGAIPSGYDRMNVYLVSGAMATAGSALTPGKIIDQATTNSVTFTGLTAIPGTTLPTSAALTNASITFTAADIGRFVVGQGIPSGTLISGVSGNTATLSPPVALSSTSVSATLLSPKIQGVGTGSTTLCWSTSPLPIRGRPRGPWTLRPLFRIARCRCA